MHSSEPVQTLVPVRGRWIMLFIQVISSVAMTASFLRIISQQLLSAYFLVVPLSLFLVILLIRMSFFAVRTSSAVAGLASGTVSGILSELVVDDLMALALLCERDIICQFCMLEPLHFVAFVCLIMYCFYVSCLCTYDWYRIFLSVMLLFPLMIAYVVLRLVKEDLIELVTLCVLMVYFIIFRICRILMKLQLFFLWLVLCFLSVHWQIRFLDSLCWDWNRQFLPVPGSAVGMTVSFLLSYVIPKPISVNRRDDCLLFAVIFHVAAFVIIRFILCFVRGGVHCAMLTGDLKLCVCGHIGFLSLFLLFFYRKLPVYKCFIFFVLILVTYICVGVVHGAVANGYFVDEVVALSLLMIMSVDSDHTQGSVLVCNDSNNVRQTGHLPH